MSSTSYQIEQECRRRQQSTLNSGSGHSVSSPDSGGSSLAPSPPTLPSFRKTLLTIYNEFDDLRQVWTDDLQTLQRAEARDSARLQSDYHMNRLEFHLCLIPAPRSEQYILSGRRNRFFIWCPQNADLPLQCICTPWSVEGLRNALNIPGEKLVIQPIRQWDSTSPTLGDIYPWPFANVPPDWYIDEDDVLCDHYTTDFRIWDLHNRQPIAFYCSKSGNEDANLFTSDDQFYLYKPFHDEIFEMPDLKDQDKLRKLGEAPDFDSLQLIRLGPAEMFGGRRTLDETTIPDGWTKLPWDPAKQVSGLPTHWRHLYITAVLSTVEGTRHILEIGYEYYLWFEPEQTVSKIEAPKGLEGILRTIRSGLLLDLRRP